MKYKELLSRLKSIEFKGSIGPERGHILYDFIHETQPSECLELGCAQGSSSCYIAAALDEIGSGHLTAVDLYRAMEWQKPPIEEVLTIAGLSKYVTVARENTSYTWYLKKKIEEMSGSTGCDPIYDFCFIDGGKNWHVDGLAFFLVDKLLKQDGWILFDDYGWVFKSALKWGLPWIDNMGEDELNTPHIESVFKLLVMQHPNYTDFKIQDNWWAWAHKTQSSKRTLIVEKTFTSYKANARRKLDKLQKMFR